MRKSGKTQRGTYKTVERCNSARRTSNAHTAATNRRKRASARGTAIMWLRFFRRLKLKFGTGVAEYELYSCTEYGVSNRCLHDVALLALRASERLITHVKMAYVEIFKRCIRQIQLHWHIIPGSHIIFVKFQRLIRIIHCSGHCHTLAMIWCCNGRHAQPN